MPLNILKNYKFQKNDILTFFLMSMAFVIPFGSYYNKKVIFITFIVWFMIFGFKNMINIVKNDRFLTAFLLFFLLYIISLLWSDNIDKGYDYILKLFIFMIVPLIIMATSANKKNMNMIITSFIFSMFINEIISYLIYFDLYETEYSAKYHYPVGFINHISYSVLVAFSSILILHQSKYMKNVYLKTIYIVFFITMTVNLVISSGRTGYVAYFATLVILLFTFYKVSLKNFLQMLLFPIVIFTIGYQLNSTVQKRISSTITDVSNIAKDDNYNTSFGTRLAAYPIAWNVLKDNNFLFGVGVGDLEEAKNSAIYNNNLKNKTRTVLHHDHLHNFFADTVVIIGLIGLILLLMSFYFLWKIKIINTEYKFLQQLIILIIFTSCFADRILHIQDTMLFFAVFVGLIVAQNKIENEIKK